MKNQGLCLEITLMSTLCTIITTSGMVYSLQAIFFPHEAEGKGAHAFAYGLIFAIYELVLLFASPILGSHIHLFHLKTTILVGMLLCGFSTILFGLTYKFESTWAFLLSCSALRVCEGIGATFILTGSLVFVATEFPHSMATYTGVLQTGFIIGSGIGPSVGAPLFQLGGFEMPFLCVGGFLVVLILLPFFLIPNKVKSDTSVEPGQGFGYFRLLRTPSVLLYAFNIVMVGVGVMFLLSMLEPYVRRFELTENELGLLFLVMNGVYALGCLLSGWVTDRLTNPGLLSLTGLLFFAMAFLLIGPASFIPIIPHIGWTVGGLVLVGLGQGAVNISTYIEMIHESERAGFADEMSRTGLVTGLFVSCYALGGFVGPTLGGLLVTHFGFQFVTGLLFIAYTLLAIMLGVFLRRRVTQHFPLQ